MTTTIKLASAKHHFTMTATGHPVKVGDWLLLFSKNPGGSRAMNNVWRIDHFPTGCRFSGRMFATQQECADYVRDVTPSLSPQALAKAASWPVINDTESVKFKEM